MRLTNAIRDQIRRRMLEHAFGEEETRLIHRENDLAEAVFRSTLGDADVERMEALPDGWLPTTQHLHVRFGDNGSHARLRLAQERRVPAEMDYGVFAQFPTDHELTKTWRALREAQKDLDKRRNEVGRRLKATLGSVSSTKKLAELWPESAPFLPEEAPPSNLPAVPTKELNRALGLAA